MITCMKKEHYYLCAYYVNKHVILQLMRLRDIWGKFQAIGKYNNKQKWFRLSPLESRRHKSLGEWKHVVDICPFFTRETFFWLPVCFTAHQLPCCPWYKSHMNKKHLSKKYGNVKPLLQSNLSKLYPALTLVLWSLCKQCRTRSVGFFRSQLIWVYIVCH